MRDRPTPLTLATLGLAFAAFAWAYGPLLFEFAANIWAYKPHYQHFPFVVLAAFLLMWRAGSDPTQGPSPGPYWAPAGFVVAWLLMIPAFLVPSPLLAVASLILLVGAVGCVLVRAVGQRFPLGSWSLLWLILPLPGRVDGLAIEALQRQSSVLASYALDVLGINHLMDGNALVLLDKTLFVDEACSGIVSAISIVACAAMFCVWRRRTFVHTLVVVALAAYWAMLLNVCRIVAIALAHEWADWDLAEGLAHTGIGLVAFGAALLTLVASDWLAIAVLAEIGPRREFLTAEPMRFGSSLVSVWDTIASRPLDSSVPRVEQPAHASVLDQTMLGQWSAAVILAFAAVGGLNLLRFNEEELTADFPQAMEFVAALQEIELPKEFNGLRLVVGGEHERRTSQSLLAEHSVVWRYSDDRHREYLVSCDFPYVGGWHDLTVCYQGIGWQVNETKLSQLAMDEAGNRVYDVASLDLSRPGGELLTVTYTGSLLDGTAIEAPAATLMSGLQRAFLRGQIERRLSFQVQVYGERVADLTEADREGYQELLDLVFRHIQDVALPALGNAG